MKIFKKIEKPSDLLKHPFQKIMGVVGVLIYQLFIFFKTKNKLPENPRSILVVRRNRLGDAVITALVLRELKKSNPDLSITVITNSYCSPVYEKIFSDLDVISVPDKYFGSPLGLMFHPKIRKMRLRNYDIAINASATYSSKAIYLLNCFRSRYKIAVGHPKNRKFWELFLDNAESFDQQLGKKHQIWKICSVFKRTGLKFSSPLLAGASTSNVRKILLCPEVNRVRSQWPISSWVSLFNSLESYGYEVFFCASPKFEQNLDKLIRPKSVVDLMNLVQDFDLIICQEGGTSHLAAVFDKHLITLSGVAIKSTWFPWTVTGHLFEATDDVKSISVDVVAAIAMGRTDKSKCIDQNIVSEINNYLLN